MARLDRLAGGKEVAQMGAVIGREFSFELFRSVFPIAAERLHGSLQALVAADLIMEQGQPPKADLQLPPRAGAGCGVQLAAARPPPHLAPSGGARARAR